LAPIQYNSQLDEIVKRDAIQEPREIGDNLVALDLQNLRKNTQ
jgi:hypothetical protein